jgi:hypothetical protein
MRKIVWIHRSYIFLQALFFLHGCNIKWFYMFSKCIFGRRNPIIWRFWLTIYLARTILCISYRKITYCVEIVNYKSTRSFPSKRTPMSLEFGFIWPFKMYLVSKASFSLYIKRSLMYRIPLVRKLRKFQKA